MASLNTNEKQVLEKLLGMGSGYVLNFSDRTMQEYFRDDLGIDIYHERYSYGRSGSKANRMRGFWQTADDSLVGKSINGLIDYIGNQILLGNLKVEDCPTALMDRSKQIAVRLSGVKPHDAQPTENEFVSREFKNLSIEKLGLDSVVSGILNQRIMEIRKCLTAQSSLAVIFLCGSTLEGVLLGIASSRPKDFNLSSKSPKDKQGNVKPFHAWTLNDFIEVARDLRLLGDDVKKFSHALRDFRNYIHPYQQVASGFNPDEHTAKICWQVLQAAIVQLSK
jgi:hypothetical protein